jgi:hypothetical protein
MFLHCDCHFFVLLGVYWTLTFGSKIVTGDTSAVWTPSALTCPQGLSRLRSERHLVPQMLQILSGALAGLSSQGNAGPLSILMRIPSGKFVGGEQARLLQRLHHLDQLQRLSSLQTLFLPGHIHTPGLESSYRSLWLLHQPIEERGGIFGSTT